MLSDVCTGQRSDPGVELLFGQLGRESVAATLPKVGGHVVENFFFEGLIVRAGG
jgi:hypothetical protein